ncbi:archaellin/type IV pilin N-terminal domain-containing protein [Halorubrum sp. ARQ200]|uniref:archaellin/type IV pilin N-terminal domain-containing protein n=1 Tax=Halorubrum sp. ARQ200 TaxID=1855872 RepID=UPI0010F57C6E|nr:archaellin/type IV pilin N-terminal domain-containing protein [Halorubrum sp. ARQ200]TKX43565.1 flagellin [Halorubrum sp. ARQ200]
MFEKITNDEHRGQVGIGTLIVFIAMVLVAAIAAGVLINTAGFLQTQAEATGEESTDLVSERIDVTSSVGIVGSEGDGELNQIRISVSGAAGADQIDLSETTIQAVGPNGQANLVFTDTDANGNSPGSNGFDPSTDGWATQIDQGEFVVLQNGNIASDSEAVLNDDDQFTIVVNPAAQPFGDLDGSDSPSGVYGSSQFNFAHGDSNAVFGQGDSSSLDIVSPSSATTSIELTAPDLFNTDGEAVRL